MKSSMTEKNAAGFRELVYAVAWAAMILVVYDLADTAMRMWLKNGDYAGRNLVLTITAIAAGCVLAYFVMTRYASVYIYDIDEKSLRLTRKIGKREKAVEIKNKEIRSFSAVKPQCPPKTVVNMRKTVFSDKKLYYLVYRQGGESKMAVFEPSERLAAEISSRIKEG